jgi:hypothetical protein
MNRHERRKAESDAKKPGKRPKKYRALEKMFDLSDEEMEQILPYEHSRQQDIPLDILHIMYKGARDVNPYFALQVLDWIALRHT